MATIQHDHLTRSELIELIPDLTERLLSHFSSGDTNCLCQDGGAAWKGLAEMLQEHLSPEQLFMAKKSFVKISDMRLVEKDGVARLTEIQRTQEEMRLYFPRPEHKCASVSVFLPELIRTLSEVAVE